MNPLRLGLDEVRKCLIGCQILSLDKIVLDTLVDVVGHIRDGKLSGRALGEADEKGTLGKGGERAITAILVDEAEDEAVEPHGTNVAFEFELLDNGIEPVEKADTLLLIDQRGREVAVVKVVEVGHGESSLWILELLFADVHVVLVDDVGKALPADGLGVAKSIVQNEPAQRFGPLALVGDDDEWFGLLAADDHLLFVVAHHHLALDLQTSLVHARAHYRSHVLETRTALERVKGGLVVLQRFFGLPRWLFADYVAQQRVRHADVHTDTADELHDIGVIQSLALEPDAGVRLIAKHQTSDEGCVPVFQRSSRCKPSHLFAQRYQVAAQCLVLLLQKLHLKQLHRIQQKHVQQSFHVLPVSFNPVCQSVDLYLDLLCPNKKM